MRSSKSRSRSKSNRQRSLGNIVNRVFDSSGPEGKVRGTPQQIIEKYLTLARDAQLSNDRVAEQAFFQHAEHYTRLLGEALREQAERNQSQQGGSGQRDDDRDREDRGDRGDGQGRDRHQRDGGSDHREQGRDDRGEGQGRERQHRDSGGEGRDQQNRERDAGGADGRREPRREGGAGERDGGRQPRADGERQRKQPVGGDQPRGDDNAAPQPVAEEQPMPAVEGESQEDAGLPDAIGDAEGPVETPESGAQSEDEKPAPPSRSRAPRKPRSETAAPRRRTPRASATPDETPADSTASDQV